MITTWKILIVFIGGGIGSSIRFILSTLVNNIVLANSLKNSQIPFPFGTLTVNLLGCFLIGIFAGITKQKPNFSEVNLLLSTGMMGGLTTFSTFSYENILLLKESQYLKAFINIMATFSGCLLLTFISFYITTSYLSKNI